MLQKTLLLILSTIVMLAVSNAAAAAFDPFPDKAVDCSNAKMKESSVCNTDMSDPLTGENGLLLKAVNVMAYIGGVGAVILIIISGINFMTSGGDANKAATARKILLDTVIGLLIIILAKAIVTWVVLKL